MLLAKPVFQLFTGFCVMSQILVLVISSKVVKNFLPGVDRLLMLLLKYSRAKSTVALKLMFG